MNLQTMYHKNSMKIKNKQKKQNKKNKKKKTTATCIELVLRQSTQSWNACQIIFGSYHQNDVRFSDQSRGFQCTGMLFICYHTQLLLI